MPNKIKPKRSYTANAVPVVSGNTPDIEQHEMAVNWTDGKLFTRDANNQLVSITLGGSGSIPTASASVLGGVKVGSGLTITDGVLAATGGGGSLSGSVTIPASGDQFWTQTQLLLKGDGDLTDSSSYARSVTAYGNAAATGTAKYGSNSLAFDGTGDYLRVAGSAGFSFPGDFTLETWVFFNAASASFDGAYGACLMATYPAGQGGNQGWQLRINGTSSGYNTINVYTGTTDLNWTATFNLNQWHHVAVTRSGSSIRAFVDGVQVGSTVTNSDDMTPGATTDLWIGQLNAHPYLFSLNGRLDDLRVTKGTARFTANFTPPAVAAGTGTYTAAQTYPVTITGGGSDSRWDLFLPPAPTSLTATAGNAQVSLSWTAPSVLSVTPITDYVVQYSSNSGSSWTTFSDGTSTATSATVTGLTNGTGYIFRVAAVNGVGQGAWSTATSSVTPGVPTDPYFSNVSLLLHCDGSNGSTTFTDLSLNGHAITRYGNAAISTTQSRFGGASLYLDGDGDYLEIPDHASFDFGAGEFTIEFWAFCTDQSTPYPTYIANGTAGFESGSWSIRYDNSGQPQRFGVFWNPSDPLHSTASAYSFNQWRHVAVVRDGNTIRTYVDGVQQASTAVGAGRTLDLTQGGHGRIGSARWDGGDGFLKDYIDSFRITKGVCRYPSGTTFTPPTAAFPDA
jgi:hypothetical protein